MSRVKYLIITSTSINLIIKYLRYCFFLFFIKKKRKIFINNYRKYYNKKNYTFDFFSQNTFDWINILNKFKKKDFNYLEIGSFEGNSALFILNYFQTNSVFCVDPWIQLEGNEDIAMKDKKKNFDQNLKPFEGRFKKKK